MENKWISINKQLPPPYTVVEVKRDLSYGIGGTDNFPVKYEGKGRLKANYKLKRPKKDSYPSLSDWVFELLEMKNGFDILNGFNQQPTHWRKII